MRLDWDEYFLQIAEKVAERASCDRKHVGYIAIKDRRILATGYNGSISGLPSCDDVGHLMISDHCLRTIHAETNVLVQAAKYGISLDGASFYGTWGPPCWDCFKLVANAGIKRIVYRESTDERHQNSLVVNTAKELGIELVYKSNLAYAYGTKLPEVDT